MDYISKIPPAAQAKLITVLRGRILDVAVDIRRGSPTYGKFVSKELSADSGLQMYIPVGFAHGFLTLRTTSWCPTRFPIITRPSRKLASAGTTRILPCHGPWLALTLFLSDKDRQHPLLKEFSSPFEYDGSPLGSLWLNALL